MQRLVTVVAGVCLLLGATRIAEANGSPLRVVLTYLPEVSNWGPRGATGIAELVMAEGQVKLTALGLPALNQEVYVVWLVNTKTNQALALGQLNADDQGEARLERVLSEAIPDQKWDLLLLTVEKAVGERSTPGERRAIAGFINDHVQMAMVPQQLPRTGGVMTPREPQQTWPASHIVAAGNVSWLLAVSALVGGAAATICQALYRRRHEKTAGRKELRQ